MNETTFLAFLVLIMLAFPALSFDFPFLVLKMANFMPVPNLFDGVLTGSRN